jgi:hypothetical protein
MMRSPDPTSLSGTNLADFETSVTSILYIIRSRMVAAHAENPSKAKVFDEVLEM